MAVPELPPVGLHDAEGIEQHGPAAHLPPAPRGDAPELASGIDGDGGAFEPALAGREQVERDGRPLPRAGRRDGDGGALERPADEGCAAPGAPLAQEDAVPLRQPSQVVPAQQARLAVKIGLGAAAAAAAAQMPESGDGHLEPDHAEQHDGRAGHHQQREARPVEPVEPGHCVAERPRVLQRPHDAHPERPQAHGQPPAVEAEAEPQEGVLAVGGEVDEERRSDDRAETDGGDVFRPVSVDQPRRPARPGRQQEGAKARLDQVHSLASPPGVAGSNAATLSSRFRRAWRGRRPGPRSGARTPPPPFLRPARPRPRPRPRARRSSRGRPWAAGRSA